MFTERNPGKFDLGGGIAIVFRKNLKLKKCKITKFSSFEHVTASLETEEGVLFITSLYYLGYSAKHRFTYAAFTADLKEKLKSKLNVDGKQFIFGDLNIHMEDPSLDETLILIIISDENCYTQPEVRISQLLLMYLF